MRNKVLKGILMAVIGALITLFSSCAETKLKIGVEAAKQKCPISYGKGQIADIDYQDDEVNIVYVLDDRGMDLDEAAARPDEMKSMVLKGLKNKYAKKVVDFVIDADADLNFVCKGRTSGKETKISFTSEELKRRIFAERMME